MREIEDALEAADPNADIAFDVHCEACGHAGTAQLDAGELLWDEIDARARALLGEVHLLASAYGWTEREILALSAARRATYLSMVARMKGLLHRLAARAAGTAARPCGRTCACRSAAWWLGWTEADRKPMPRRWSMPPTDRHARRRPTGHASGDGRTVVDASRRCARAAVRLPRGARRLR